MAIDQSVINFAVYEDSVEYLGMSKVTLPDVTFLTQSISGAGVGGNVEAVILGHLEAMTLGLEFRTTTPQSVQLSELRRHNIDLRMRILLRARSRHGRKSIFSWSCPNRPRAAPLPPQRPPLAPVSTLSATGQRTSTVRRCVNWTPSTSSATSTVWIIWPVSVRPWASNPHIPFRRSCILQSRPIF